MKLGGWLRLWIVLSVLYGLLIAAVAYDERPTLAKIQDDWVSEACDVIAERISLKSGKSMSGYDLHRRWEKDRANYQLIESFERIEHTPNDEQKEVSPEITKINAKYRTLVAELGGATLQHTLQYFSAWLVPSLFALAFGWAIGWVLGGFREKRP